MNGIDTTFIMIHTEVRGQNTGKESFTGNRQQEDSPLLRTGFSFNRIRKPVIRQMADWLKGGCQIVRNRTP